MGMPYQPMYPVSGNTVGGRDKALCYAVVASAALYIIACAVHIYALATFNSLVEDGDVFTDRANSVASLANNSQWAVLVLLFVTLGLFIAFFSLLNRRLVARVGPRASLSRTPAFITWRVGVVVSLLLSFFLNSSVDSSSPDASSALDRELLYYAVRMVIGGVYIWCAFSMRKAAAQLATSAPAFTPPPQAGYPVPGAYPVQGGGYPVQGGGYPVQGGYPQPPVDYGQQPGWAPPADPTAPNWNDPQPR